MCKNQETNLSIFKGDLSDQRHTLVLGPSVGQVKVGDGAEVDHVWDALPHRFVDHIVSSAALGLRHSTTGGKWLRGAQEGTPKISTLHMGFI